MKKCLKKFTQIRNILFFIALVLLLVFSLHVIELNHSHPEVLFGTGIQAVLHGDDRTWWLVLIAISFILSIAAIRLLPKIDSSCLRHSQAKATIIVSTFVYKLLDSLRTAFRRGILHPKICE